MPALTSQLLTTQTVGKLSRLIRVDYSQRMTTTKLEWTTGLLLSDVDIIMMPF